MGNLFILETFLSNYHIFVAKKGLNLGPIHHTNNRERGRKLKQKLLF